MLRLEIEGVTAAEATEYILAGLQRRLDTVQAQIDAVSQGTAPEIRTRPGKSAAPKGSAVAKGTVSAEGRAKIILAQKKRWARVRKEAKLAAKAAAAGTGSDAGETAGQNAAVEEVSNETVSA